MSEYQVILSWRMLSGMLCIMETKVIPIDPENIDEGAIKAAAASIDAGNLVGFPTETVYGIACRVRADSLDRLDEIKGRMPEKHYTLHIGSKSLLRDYVPAMSLRAKKLVENAWPGPLTIVFELNKDDLSQQKAKTEPEIFECLYADNSIGIRCPDNAVARNLLTAAKIPIVAPSANLTGKAAPVDAKGVLAQLRGKIDLLLDGGLCRYKKSSTVVKVGTDTMQILRPGVYTKEEIQKMSTVRFLFVCTGNTCRSPMAEGIFRACLAKKLGCKVDEVEQIGYKICSAGIMELSGVPVSAEAVRACAKKGVDISAHKNTVLSELLIDESDYIFVMSRTHLHRALAMSPEAQRRCVLLAEDRDIDDPIGLSQEEYGKCADLIGKSIKRILGRLRI